MSPDQITQMIEMIQALGPQKVRVIQYEINGGHDCHRSTYLINCCGEKRCQACHIPHLKSVHGDAALHAYQKFASAQTLTWKGRDYKEPAKPKSNKSTRKAVSKSARAPEAKSFAASIPDDKIAGVMAILESMRNK